MTSEKGSRKDKNQNIQVFVRLRPLNQRERDIKSLGVIEVAHNREVVVRQSQPSNHTKKFTFDRAFGPQAKQVEIYQDVVSPLIEEVLAGYNCTVFAYGQTGTGKTHTMVGESTGDEHNWQNDPLAGIIPRALSQLFDELRLSNTEYTVRVSYLELYNEELFDLLSTSEDNSKLRIYEDVTRKGSNIVNGLEEITVSNKNEVYKIMAQGQERKRVASTLMNAQSSRSHTVFTIVVHMRENSPEGEELVKIGKLNLVDLAGSENISKAGSDNPAKRERARECVNINQSLLTLGRVITALVERHPHIPYRESKLTRILQESLGGRTKTSIIATISPGHKDLEETMSTLEYAHRAKNIQNKPEVNQKMTKKAILKEYVEEIDRLKRDLQASRDKNGVYLPTDTYTEITLKQEELRKEIQELLLQKRAVEEQMDKAAALFSDTLEKKDTELSETRNILVNTASELQSTRLKFEEQKHLVEKVSATERALSAQARDILLAADVATTHAHCLHDTVDKRRNVESRNLQVTASFREQATQHRANIAAGTKHFTMTLVEELTGLHSALNDFATTNTTTLRVNEEKLEDLLQQIDEIMNEIKILNRESHSQLVSCTESQRARIRSCVRETDGAMESAVSRLVQRAAAALHAARQHDAAGKLHNFVHQWHQGAAARVSSLCQTQRAFVSRMRHSERSQIETATAQKNSKLTKMEQKNERIKALHEKVERVNMESEKRLTEQMKEIQAECEKGREKLHNWLEKEKNRIELEKNRLELHVEDEIAELELKLSKKMEAIEQERLLLQGSLASHLEEQERELASNAHETQLEMQALQQWETTTAEDSQCVRSYDKDFEEGTSAISTDMEIFSSNVVDVVDNIFKELLNTMELTTQQTQTETQAVVSQVEAIGAQFIGETSSALEDIVATNKRAGEDMLQSMQAKTSTTTDTLRAVSTSLNSLMASSERQRCSHQASVQEMTAQVSLFEDNLRNAVVNLEHVEAKCLTEEYKVYSPTGKTPSRVAFSYPRTLAATSPHERIVARFRAMRDNSNDDECVVVESDGDSRVSSDGESSASEECGVFAEPSPPPPRTPRSNSLHGGRRQDSQGLVKCTSETDIYPIKRQQAHGKENANRSITYKKPSKLPAPSTQKKPFLERNGTDN